jgi:hypothetical protein
MSDLDKLLGLHTLPVDVGRQQRILASGAPITPDHLELKPNGQQKDYIVLTDAEIADGLIRPLRMHYRHENCGTVTTMGLKIAKTYARDPTFYSGTFCVACGKHFPIGANGNFVWDDGTKVGT